MADANTTQPAMPEGVETDPNAPVESDEKDDDTLTRDIEKHFKGQLDQAERVMKDRRFQWRRNIELRQGNPNGTYTSFLQQDANDEYQSEYNPDWFLTKTKMAAMFSQVPKVQLTHEMSRFGPAVGPFARAINYELDEKRTNAGAAMTEVGADVVNASGVGAIEVGYAARFEPKRSPAVDVRMLDPKVVEAGMEAGVIPSKIVQRAVDYRFFFDRFSPTDILAPASFIGSDFDKGPWVGKRFKSTWAESKLEFKLDDDVKDQVSGGDTHAEEKLQTGPEGSAPESATVLKDVKGKRVYYWRYRVDADCKYFNEIWEIVWLEGLDKPVRHEKWKGQRFDEQSKLYIGACRFPIRVCTVTYITDNPIPPSDSQASRPQVNDLRRSRQQTFANRAFSTPLRWFNTDKVEPTMHDLMMRGQVQGMIPVQGKGTDMIGEVARASYPAEDFTFDKMTESDLYKMWMLGPNQMGMISDHTDVTKAEVQSAQGGFESVMGFERTRVAKFFLGAVEVLAGLMALYSDFRMLSPEEKQAMASAWDNRTMLHDLAFKILPDSQIILSTDQQIKRLMSLLNITAKSGFMNTKKLIAEITELHGKDPNEYIVDPQPHPMKPASVSFGFRGKEDLQNPIVVAILSKNGQFPTPEEVAASQQMLMTIQSGQIVQPPPKPGQMPPGGPRPPQQMGPRPVQPALPPPNQDHAPQWGLAGKIAKRSRDMAGGGR